MNPWIERMRNSEDFGARIMKNRALDREIWLQKL
jgi:hypothetical protein